VTELLTDETRRLQLRRGAEAALETFSIQAMAQRFADGVRDALTSGRLN
jgi:hypothetical protein